MPASTTLEPTLRWRIQKFKPLQHWADPGTSLKLITLWTGTHACYALLLGIFGTSNFDLTPACPSHYMKTQTFIQGGSAPFCH